MVQSKTKSLKELMQERKNAIDTKQEEYINTLKELNTTKLKYQDYWKLPSYQILDNKRRILEEELKTERLNYNSAIKLSTNDLLSEMFKKNQQPKTKKISINNLAGAYKFLISDTPNIKDLGKRTILQAQDIKKKLLELQKKYKQYQNERYDKNYIQPALQSADEIQGQKELNKWKQTMANIKPNILKERGNVKTGIHNKTMVTPNYNTSIVPYKEKEPQTNFFGLPNDITKNDSPLNSPKSMGIDKQLEEIPKGINDGIQAISKEGEIIASDIQKEVGNIIKVGKKGIQAPKLIQNGKLTDTIIGRVAEEDEEEKKKKKKLEAEKNAMKKALSGQTGGNSIGNPHIKQEKGGIGFSLSKLLGRRQ